MISIKRITGIGFISFDYCIKISSNKQFIAAFQSSGYLGIADLNLSTNNRLFQDEKLTALDFSSDSKYIVIASRKNNFTIKIWDTINNEILANIF